MILACCISICNEYKKLQYFTVNSHCWCKNKFLKGNSNSSCEIREQLYPTAYGHIWTHFWDSQHVTLRVMHFPFVLTWELCIQGADPPSEFIRRNNNQCKGLGCWASRSILQLSVGWNSGWHKCSLLWSRTRRTQQYFPSLFYWNARERFLFGDCIIPLLWGQTAAQSQCSIWEFRRWWWRCWNVPALITYYHLTIIIKADSK